MAISPGWAPLYALNLFWNHRAFRFVLTCAARISKLIFKCNNLFLWLKVYARTIQNEFITLRRSILDMTVNIDQISICGIMTIYVWETRLLHISFRQAQGESSAWIKNTHFIPVIWFHALFIEPRGTI